MSQNPLPPLISEADKKLAKRSRMWVMGVLALIGVGGVGLGVNWAQTGAWTPDWHAPNPAVVCPVWPITPASPSKVSLNVFNVSEREGIATEAADVLRKRGFDVRTVRNATLDQDTAVATATIYAGPKDTTQALALQNQLPGAKVVLQPDRTNGVLDVALGRDYRGVNSEAGVTQEAGTLTCTQPWFER